MCVCVVSLCTVHVYVGGWKSSLAKTLPMLKIRFQIQTFQKIRVTKSETLWRCLWCPKKQITSTLRNFGCAQFGIMNMCHWNVKDEKCWDCFLWECTLLLGSVIHACLVCVCFFLMCSLLHWLSVYMNSSAFLLYVLYTVYKHFPTLFASCAHLCLKWLSLFIHPCL